jgi:hypothetical protein
MDGGQIGIVGLVVRIGRLTELFGGVGVDQARVEVGLGEGVLDGMVIAARAFDSDETYLITANPV